MKILEIEKTAGNEQTPLRVAKMWVNELFKNRNNKNIDDLNATLKFFDVPQNPGLIIMKDIKFNSICEHHWLPFSGVIDVAYVPTAKIVGLSKIPRAVKFFSQKPQLQERLVIEIGEYLVNKLKPECLYIRATATHACVMCRGIESDCQTDTLYKYGDDSYLFEFFMRLGEKE
jgi:GTP cyclohydrolase I